MSAQPATNEIVQWATEQHAKYKPSDETKQKLSRISIGMLVGPTAVGKSFLINKLTELDGRFSGMGTITTREQRKSDPDNYSFISPDEFAARIESGDLVQYEIHPTTGDFYGSDYDSFNSGWVIAPVLAKGLKPFKEAGFKLATPIGIVSPAKEWSERLAVHADGEDLKKRLHEALLAIEWLRGHRFNTPILSNGSDNIDKTIEKISKLTTGNNRVHYHYADAKINAVINEMQMTAKQKLRELDRE